MRNRLVVIAALMTLGASLSLAGGAGGSPGASRPVLGDRPAAQVLAAATSAAPGSAAPGTHSQQMQQCIQNCGSCRAICLKTLDYCRKKGGQHAAPDHLRVLQDCAEICQTSASFMRRGSAFHARTCGLCAEVCEGCAQTCDKFPNDAQMKACAAECRRCMQSCRVMAGTAS